MAHGNQSAEGQRDEGQSSRGQISTGQISEDPSSHAGIRSRLVRGIESGIVGGAAMLGMLVCESLWNGHVWWEVPNLLGSTFYGTRVLRSGADLSILAGTALHLAITGTLGGLFGLACGGIQQRGRLILLGVLAGVGWYNFANVIFWPKVNPWVPVVSPRPVTMYSYIVFGVCLGYMGQRNRASPAVVSVGYFGSTPIPPGGPAADGHAGADPAPVVAAPAEPAGVRPAATEPAADGHVGADPAPVVATPAEPAEVRPATDGHAPDEHAGVGPAPVAATPAVPPESSADPRPDAVE
jgi:hypothetical protein